MSQVHFEVFVRKTPQAPWRLEMATEDRADAMATAEDVMSAGRVAAVRVTKETLDADTMEFASVTLLTRGAPDTERKKPVRDASADPVCTGPIDLYNAPAREKIQRLLDDWLRRNRATPFELLHRPDLVEKLEASGMELQHAIQKIAVPESQVSGQPVHEVIRAYQRLTEQAIERVIRAGRLGLFPQLEPGNVAEVSRRLLSDKERQFILGGAVAVALAPLPTWREKVARLLDFAEATPDEPHPRALCQVVIEQPLAEIVGSRAGLADLLGAEGMDLGANLAALVRIAAPREVEAMLAMDASLTRLVPTLSGPAQRLADRLNAGDFKVLGTVLARRVLTELMGPRRLRPADARGEIEILRALALILTASAGRLLSIDEVQRAFIERSKAIVAADFVEAYLGQGETCAGEAQALVKLCENVAGGANKRQAARWLMGCVAALRFEREYRSSGESAAQRLAGLAALQRSIGRIGLPDKEGRDIHAKLGEVGGLVEADSRICQQLGKAQASVVQKLSALLKMATGEAAPLGPAADRARAEVSRLIRTPEARAALAAPDAAERVRPLLQQAGLMAA